MGFVEKGDYEQFLHDTPKFEKMLQNAGIKIIKFYFSVGKAEQAKRFEARRTRFAGCALAITPCFSSPNMTPPLTVAAFKISAFVRPALFIARNYHTLRPSRPFVLSNYIIQMPAL